jgi:hypothetical protein
MAQMQQQWVAQNCNPQAAYNTGLQAGLTPNSAPDPSYLNQCSINQFPQLSSSYLEGFRKGVSSRPNEVNVNTNFPSGDRPRRYCNNGGPFWNFGN